MIILAGYAGEKLASLFHTRQIGKSFKNSLHQVFERMWNTGSSRYRPEEVQAGALTSESSVAR